MADSIVVLRQRACRAEGCGALFFICRSCDRGQSYCSQPCRRLQRRQQCRAANRRHQLSPEGRADHCDRQRAYRQRQQHLAAIRMLFDWLVIGQVVPINPAAVVRGPRHVVKRGKTPVLLPEQARHLLDSIPLENIVGFRDRTIIGVMCYTFGRVQAIADMVVPDYYLSGARRWFRLHEKGGRLHLVPAHHNAQDYVDAFLAESGLLHLPARKLKTTPLFPAVDRRRQLTDRPLTRRDVLRMIKRRARPAGLPSSTSCHTMRSTGITAYLSNGGTLEKAQEIAGHATPKTTKIYDHSGDEITLDEVERIGI